MNNISVEKGWLKGTASQLGINHVTGDDAIIRIQCKPAKNYDDTDLDVALKHPNYLTVFKMYQFPDEIRRTLRALADPLFFYCVVYDRDGGEEMHGPYDSRAEADYVGEGLLDELRWVSYETLGELEL